MVKKFSIFLLVMALAFAFSSVVSAAPVTVNGLTFAEQTGAFTITGGSGIGTEGDPIVLFEDVSGLDVTMSISGLPGFGNLSGSGHATGFWLEKHVTNLTGETWNFYDHELQEILGTASSDGDGLSFAQGSSSVRPWTSDTFASYNEVIDVRDYINFYNGSVAPGETVIFSYVITDNSPIDNFYLRQRPNFQGGTPIPEPATMLLLGSGLVGLAGLRRKFRKS